MLSMTGFNYKEWFNNVFWPTYDSKYCGGSAKKGPKSKPLTILESKIKKIVAIENKTMESACNDVLLALQAQIKFYNDAQAKGEWQANFPMVSTWVNQERWSIEIESHSELKARHESKTCHYHDCDKETHGPRFNYCTKHLTHTTQFKQEVKASLVKNGLMKKKGETPIEWQQRLRNYILKAQEKIDNRVIG